MWSYNYSNAMKGWWSSLSGMLRTFFFFFKDAFMFFILWLFFVEITVYVTIYVLRATLQRITPTTKVPIYTDTSLDPFPIPNLPPSSHGNCNSRIWVQFVSTSICLFPDSSPLCPTYEQDHLLVFVFLLLIVLLNTNFSIWLLVKFILFWT